ncbi:MAG: UbiX family flavin prenyltransferase [Acidobacteriota bacterium]
MTPRRLVVGISGASAPIYGIRTLELLRDVPDVETHLVYTRTAERTIALETGRTLDDICGLADVVYRPEQMEAAVSSGSFQTIGMLIAPCSINTLSSIAASFTKDLLTRAADVTLKEKRALVLMLRESPLHLGHLRRMVEAAEIGATIAPPIPSFYHRPRSIDDLINHSIGRTLSLLGIELPSLKRWETPED